jgi:hypothetical protein
LSACLVLLLAAAGDVPAQVRRPGDTPEVFTQGRPDQAKGREILEEFRRTGWGLGGDYYLEFELRVRPRRGDERVVPGRMWGGRNERGPVTRVALHPGVKDAERRLLVQTGPDSAAWHWPAEGLALPGAGGTPAPQAASLFAPLAGTDLTAFDLQMPFLWWTDFTYEGTAPVRSRPAHVFLLRPPAAIAALRPGLTGVRVWLDTEFNALLQATETGPGGAARKTITVLDLKKIGDRWIVETVDLRDEVTRDKTQFAVTGAALGQNFLPALFDPARLADEGPTPPAERVTRVAP